MKKFWPWIIGLTVLFLLIGVMLLFGTGLLRFQRNPMMWYGEGDQTWRGDYGGFPSMGMHGRRGFSLLGSFGWMLMLLFPLGILTLVVLGVFFLVRSLSNNNTGSPSQPLIAHCDHCGRKVEADWKVCPYCGELLGEE